MINMIWRYYLFNNRPFGEMKCYHHIKREYILCTQKSTLVNTLYVNAVTLGALLYAFGAYHTCFIVSTSMKSKVTSPYTTGMVYYIYSILPSLRPTHRPTITYYLFFNVSLVSPSIVVSSSLICIVCICGVVKCQVFSNTHQTCHRPTGLEGWPPNPPHRWAETYSVPWSVMPSSWMPSLRWSSSWLMFRWTQFPKNQRTPTSSIRVNTCKVM